MHFLGDYNIGTSLGCDYNMVTYLQGLQYSYTFRGDYNIATFFRDQYRYSSWGDYMR